MIRKLLFIALVGIGFFACQDDDSLGFDVPVEFERELSFEPIPGGAVMHYYLPQGTTNVFGIQARYTDAQGIEVKKSATYLNDSIQLLGFNEARTNVPVWISFISDNMELSEEKEYAFDTEDSAPIAFFDSLQIRPFWGGFSVAYTAPETVNGMVHVFYLGTNPMTQQPDSILISSQSIMSGGDTLNFVLQQTQSENTTVIVRTEDYRGYRVGQAMQDIPVLFMDTLQASDFEFRFMGEEPNEEYQEKYAFGRQYLFDGDKKGTTWFANNANSQRYKYATYVAGPTAFGERFIIDLKEQRVPATVRLYAFINFDIPFPAPSYPTMISPEPFLTDVFSSRYFSVLPAKVKLYGTNENPETVDLSSCTLLFELDDDVSYDDGFRNSWAAETTGENEYGESLTSPTQEDIDNTDPVYLDMLCNYNVDAAGNPLRFQYLIFVVEDTYNVRDGSKPVWESSIDLNNGEYVSFHELEVCVRAED